MWFTTFALRLCRWPMKCQRNRSPWAACLASRSCARFSPTTSIPASARVAMSSTETYFVAATIVTSGPTSSRTRASRAAICSADEAKDALGAARPAGAAFAEEEVCPAARAEVESIDGARSRVEGGPLGCGPQVELAAGDDPISEARPVGARDLIPHLVAARADRRPDDGGKTGPEDLCRGFHDPVEQAPPAGVDDHQRGLGAVRTGQCDQPAVGAEGQHRDAGLIRPEPVARSASRAGLGAVDDRRVRLEAERQALLVGAYLGTQAAAVLVDALDLVACSTSEVEGLERAFADAALPGREDDLVRAGHSPAEQRHAHVR